MIMRRAIVRLGALALGVSCTTSPRAAPEIPSMPDRVTIDGKPVPVTKGEGTPPTRPPSAHWDEAALRSRLGLGDDVSLFALPFAGRIIVRTWRHRMQSHEQSDLIDVARDGSRVTRHVLPFNDRGWVPEVCGDRWLVMALESDGIAVWDLVERRLVAHVPVRGRFGNAHSDGPACSPDGRHAVVPTPYGRSLTILRLADGAVVSDIPFDAPGTARWTTTGITLWSTFLPYE